MRFQIDSPSVIVGSKFTAFALFCFIFESNFFKYRLPGGLYLEGRLNGGFFTLPLWRRTFGGAYTLRGLFSEFYGTPK